MSDCGSSVSGGGGSSSRGGGGGGGGGGGTLEPLGGRASGLAAGRS